MTKYTVKVTRVEEEEYTDSLLIHEVPTDKRKESSVYNRDEPAMERKWQPVQKRREHNVTIFEQTVEDLDLKAVILAVNP